MIAVTLNIIGIGVVHGSIRDKIYLEVDNIPSAIPSDSDKNCTLSFDARKDEGVDFVLQHFGIKKAEVTITKQPSETNCKFTEIKPKILPKRNLGMSKYDLAMLNMRQG